MHHVYCMYLRDLPIKERWALVGQVMPFPTAHLAREPRKGGCRFKQEAYRRRPSLTKHDIHDKGMYGSMFVRRFGCWLVSSYREGHLFSPTPLKFCFLPSHRKIFAVWHFKISV